MKAQIPPGVFDLTPENSKDAWRSIHLWQFVEQTIRQTAEAFGFQEIRTPIFERIELFQRSVGETSDIVSKEMYQFEDRGGRLMSLRPEGTAPVMRAFIDNHLDNQAQTRKFYYLGPMFRYDRPQAGRYRQHHQFGVEAVGSADPEQDVEVIDLLYTVYQKLGIQNVRISLNTLGDQECRIRYRDSIYSYFKQFESELSEESKKRLELNPLRILDSKSPEDQTFINDAPTIQEHLSSESKQHFEQVQELLIQLNIPFTIEPKLVRGLDYYNRTVFEIVAGELGAQNSIGGGGRYDGLLKMIGGPDLPAMGFGSGIERIIQTLLAQNASLPSPPRPMVFLIPLGDEAKSTCFSLLHELRESEISAHMEFRDRKIAKTMQLANQSRTKYVVVVGEEELKSGEIDLKDMDSGQTTRVPISSLLELMRIDAHSQAFKTLWEEMNHPFERPEEANFFLKKIEQSLKTTENSTQSLRKNLEKLETLLEQDEES